jgi:hypothetical protein
LHVAQREFRHTYSQRRMVLEVRPPEMSRIARDPGPSASEE